MWVMASAQLVENRLQLGAAGDDDTGVDRAKIEQQSEVVEVAVVERVLVVPFDFQGHAILVAVDLVGRRGVFDVVHHNTRVESLFGPSETKKRAAELA